MRNNPRELLLNMHRQHVSGWQQKDMLTLRGVYAEQAVVFEKVPPPRFSDFKTFENTLHQYFSRVHDITLLTDNIQIEFSGDVGWITSQYLMAYQAKGRLQRETGRWTEIYQRENGEWKLTHFHSSPDPFK
jgi:ketosteroid isomerase-like protein